MAVVTNPAIAEFKVYCQKVLPAVYDDSLSYYELLCKVVEVLNQIIESDTDYTGDIETLKASIADLQKQIDAFKESGFDDYYKDDVQNWINNNLEYVFDTLAKQVYFGITADGYFVAYIPDSWDDIIFETGRDYSLDTYGRLILKWTVDSVHPTIQEGI